MAVPYFVLYVLIGSFVMLNVFIAVILDAFAEDEAAEHAAFKQEHIDEFTALWQRFDRGETIQVGGGAELESSNLLETRHLAAFLKELPEPMGFKHRPDVPFKEVMAKVESLEDADGPLKDRGGFVAYHDLLFALANHATTRVHGKVRLGEQVAGSEVGKALAAMASMAKAETKVYDLLPSPEEGHDVQSEFAALKVQQAIRRKNMRSPTKATLPVSPAATPPPEPADSPCRRWRRSPRRRNRSRRRGRRCRWRPSRRERRR